MHDEEMAIAVVAIVFGCPMLVIISSIVMKGIVRILCHWRDVSLKIRLAERGMTALEIESIVSAGRLDSKGRVISKPTTALPSNAPLSAASPIEGKPPRAEYAVRY